ncbi:TPA: ribosome silencing factor, partial [candidate division WOR-3]|nr:ribosome silencing factor [candidate division WOR-3 bacterium]
MIVDAILEKKGLNTVVIDLTEISPFTDYFIITTGISSVQTNAIKENIYRKLKKTYKNVNIEGENAGVWILMDYGDVVVHIFQQEERE